MNNNYNNYKYNQKNYKNILDKKAEALVEKRNYEMYIKFLIEAIHHLEPMEQPKDIIDLWQLIREFYYEFETKTNWNIDGTKYNNLNNILTDLRDLQLLRKARIRDEKIDSILND